MSNEEIVQNIMKHINEEMRRSKSAKDRVEIVEDVIERLRDEMENLVSASVRELFGRKE